MPEEENDVGKSKPIRVNYPSNSKKERTGSTPGSPEPVERKALEPVVTGKVIRRKKSVGKKLAETFTGDSAGEVGNYVFFDVIVPAIKSMIVESGKEALDRIFWGSGGGPRRSGNGRSQRGYSDMYTGRPRVDFERPGLPPRQEPQRALSQKARMTHDFDEIIVETRGEAEKVLDGLGLLVEQYGVARVSDMYELLEITPSYTDDKYGWYDLRGSSITRNSQGYLLNLPKTAVIE